MKTVLFYYPSNKQSNSLETLIEELSNQNLNILLLTTCQKGVFHETLEKKGIKTYTNYLHAQTGLIYYFKQIAFLIKFCRENNVDVVCSHLQHVNFIAVFAQFFSKARFLIFRHHFKFNVFSNAKDLRSNKMEQLFDRVINALAREIIVPSSGVYNGMITYEGVSPKKLSILPYIYNFDNYQNPDPFAVKKIKEEYRCSLLLLMCSRLIQFKRHILVFPIVKKLVNEGFDIKMLVLDEGPEKERLQHYIHENNLEQHIYMLGFKTDFVNYMAASDLMIHPSLTEASNSAVKEMGILRKAIAVCSKVGDFDDYIVNGENGFLLSPINTERDVEAIIRKALSDKELLMKVGNNLHCMVIQRFHKSSFIIDRYLKKINQA